MNGSISAGAVKPHLYVSWSRQHSASSNRASSVWGSPPEEEGVANETMVSPNVELERAKLKIKKLEREVCKGGTVERNEHTQGFIQDFRVGGE